MDSKNIESFTFLTYNLDKSQFNFEERIQSFFKLIKLTPPDIVVIQEGTRLTYEKLLREMGNMGYKRQLLDIMHHRPSGEMIFSKFPMTDVKYIQFKNSTENRGLTIHKIDMWGRYIWVVTSQFDNKISLQRSQITELDNSLKYIDSKEDIVFGGDTRIMNYQKDLVSPNRWYDAWYEAGRDDSFFSVDGTSNLLVDSNFRDRPDVIWYRPTSIECVECLLYGNKSDVTISSHYGVWAKFNFLSKK